MRFNTFWSVAFNLAVSFCLNQNLSTQFPLELPFSISRQNLQSNNGRFSGIAKRESLTGSVELDLTESQTFYHAQVLFGSQEEPISLLIDTGAVSTWVISKDVQCFSSNSIQVDPRITRRQENDNTTPSSPVVPLVPGFFPGFQSISLAPEEGLTEVDPSQCTSHGVFDSTKSTTFSIFEKMDPYNIQFQDNTFASGLWGQDTLKLGGVTLENVPFALVHKTDNLIGILGLGSDSSKHVFSQGTQYPPGFQGFPQLLKSQGHIQRAVFSLFLDKSAERGGSVLFGAVDHAKYYGTLQTVPFANFYEQYSEQPLFFDVGLDSITVKEPGKQNTLIHVGRSALLDSGGTLCSFPKDILTPLAESLGGVWREDVGLFQINRSQVKLKHVSFFISTIKITIPATRLLIRIRSGDYLGISPVDHDRLVLGEEFLRSAYVVFDTERNEVSMAQAKYSSRREIELVTGDIPRAKRAEKNGSTDTGSDSDYSSGSTSSSDNRHVHFQDEPQYFGDDSDMEFSPPSSTVSLPTSRPVFPKMGISALKSLPKTLAAEVEEQSMPFVPQNIFKEDSAIETIDEAMGFLAEEESNELSLEELEFLAEGLSPNESSDDYTNFLKFLDEELLNSTPVHTRIRKSTDSNSLSENKHHDTPPIQEDSLSFSESLSANENMEEITILSSQPTSETIQIVESVQTTEESQTSEDSQKAAESVKTNESVKTDENVQTDEILRTTYAISDHTKSTKSSQTYKSMATILAETEHLQTFSNTIVENIDLKSSEATQTSISTNIIVTDTTSVIPSIVELQEVTKSPYSKETMSVYSSTLSLYQNNTSSFQSSSVQVKDSVLASATFSLEALAAHKFSNYQNVSVSQSNHIFTPAPTTDRLDSSLTIDSVTEEKEEETSVGEGRQINAVYKIGITGESREEISQPPKEVLSKPPSFSVPKTFPESFEILSSPDFDSPDFNSPGENQDGPRDKSEWIGDGHTFSNIDSDGDFSVEKNIGFLGHSATSSGDIDYMVSHTSLLHSDLNYETLLSGNHQHMSLKVETEHKPNLEHEVQGAAVEILENTIFPTWKAVASNYELEGSGRKVVVMPWFKFLILLIAFSVF